VIIACCLEGNKIAAAVSLLPKWAARRMRSSPTPFPQRTHRRDPRAVPVVKNRDDEGTPFIGNDAHDLWEVFSDHELIRSLGCESVLNMPVHWQGRTIGTLNLLHTANWYKDVRLDFMTCAAQLAAPALLMSV
jgi:hypothetical protein